MAAYSITELQQKLLGIMDAARQEIIAAHDAAGQRASGKTADSLEVTTEKDDNGINVSLLGRRAFATLETGRKPGNVPQGFYQIIKQWSIDKGIQFEKEYKRSSFAYLVSRKIAAEGTLLYRQGGRNDIYTPTIEKYTAQIEGEVENWFDVIISSIQLNN